MRAVVLNSGGANACTGRAGFQDTHATAEQVAAALSGRAMRFPVGAIDVAVCSTGLIGERLPIAKLRAGVDAAARKLARDGGASAAEAIMTTDTRPKQAVVTEHGFTVGGMAKGAGMLAPGLATMLVVLTTDAVADAATSDAALRQACRGSPSTGSTPTAACPPTTPSCCWPAARPGSSATPEELTAAVTAVCADLAQQLLADAEGATKDIAIEVTGAASEDDAVEVGRAVARSNLVKTAFFGNDPNWGRILSAVGTTGAAFERGRRRRRDQRGLDLPRRRGRRRPLQSGPVRRAVTVTVDLHAGDGTPPPCWTNDLSLAYVHENSAYSS